MRRSLQGPGGLVDASGFIELHDHSDKKNGGTLDERSLSATAKIARLDASAAQAFANGLVVPGIDMSGGACVIPNPVTTPLQAVANGFIHSFGMVAATDARIINDPDSSGTRLLSGTVVTRSGKNANDSATILAAPAAGLYLVAWYLEITTAALVGAITLDIIATGAGGSNTQTELSGLSLTSKTARSGLAVVYVVSGDVTYATTLTAGSPVYDVRLIPLGRIA